MTSEKKGRFIEDDFDFEVLRKEILASKASAKATKRDNLTISVFRILILLTAIVIAYFSFSFIQNKINEFQNNKYESNVSLYDDNNTHTVFYLQL